MGAKVSVVIPVYNQEIFLGECLDSVLSQNLSEIEIVIVNDGSTDHSRCIIEEYRQRDSRVRAFDQVNEGSASARNRAVRLARGKYIAFMDADDFYPNADTLAFLYQKASEHGALICGGSFSLAFPGKILEVFSGELDRDNTFSREGFIRFRDYQFDFAYQRFLFSREFLLDNDLRFPPYRRFQDPPFLIQAMLKAGRFYAVRDVVYRYREGHQQNMRRWSSDKLHGLLCGVRDVFRLSAEHSLGKLHSLMTRRWEEEPCWNKAVMAALRRGDDGIVPLLAEIYQLMDVSLLATSSRLQRRIVTGRYYWSLGEHLLREAEREDMDRAFSAIFGSRSDGWDKLVGGNDLPWRMLADEADCDEILAGVSGLLVYGMGAHFLDMLSWYPELAGIVLRVFDKNRDKIGKKVPGTKLVVEAPDALRQLPKGTPLVVSAIRYYDEIVREIYDINPGVVCLDIDEAYGYFRKC